MPYLNVKVCAPASKELGDQVAALLTELTADILHKKRELTSVLVEFVPPERWYIGGGRLDAHPRATFYLEAKITEGTNSKDEKAAYVAQVFAALQDLLGPLDPASYIVLHEVRGDAWGFEGATQEFRYINGKTW